MSETIGIRCNQGSVIAQFKIGPDVFAISKAGKTYYTALNGRAILSSVSEKDLQTNTIPVLLHLLQYQLKAANTDTVKMRALEKAQNIDGILNKVKDNLRSTGVFVLEMKPDEIVENSPTVEASFPVKLKSYHNWLPKFGDNIGSTHHHATIILRTNLDKTIWGSKAIMSVFSPIRNATTDIAWQLNDIEASIERSSDNLRRLYEISCRGIVSKKINGELLDDFVTLKSYMAKLAQIVCPLYTIDACIKTATEYPATWFLDGDVYNTFMYDYKTLLGHLIKTAAIEAELMDSLLISKIVNYPLALKSQEA